ncbi:hypothetical protein GCM10022404_14500 [Celeribacter arenosi]|uniref:Uncharacterized protein n=1 Tax=Celeribacter arenosi TaxID=792649 RepID=A0ABP7K622_9RHOB
MEKTGKTGKDANKAPNAREERLKAALKANLSRRKAQARARKPETRGPKDSE